MLELIYQAQLIDMVDHRYTAAYVMSSHAYLGRQPQLDMWMPTDGQSAYLNQEIQRRLTERGLIAGEADGVIGKQTIDTIRRY